MFKKYKRYIIVFCIILIMGIGYYFYNSNKQHNILINTGTRYVDNNNRGLIKGNINSKGEKIYHMPDGMYYKQTYPEKWFITEAEAKNAGFRKSMR